MKKFKSFRLISTTILSIMICLLIMVMFTNKFTTVQENLILSGKNVKNILEVESLRPLTVEQVNKYLENKKVECLSVKNINNYTVILYQKKDFTGYYILSSSKDGKLKYENGSTGKDKAYMTPVAIGLGGGSVLDQEDYDFAWIIINDNEMLKKAYSIALMLNDGTTITESINNQKGLIIENPKGMSGAIRLNIYDKNKQSLYTQEL